MSATDQMRAMLNELMGTDTYGERPKVEFDDHRVCKSFLLGCCPHDILSGTRMDIGECSKIHDLALKADYQKHPKRERFLFEQDALEQLEIFIRDTNRRTEQARRRLKETQEELSDEATAKAEEMHRLGEEIGTKLARAEQLGAAGEVEESLKLMNEVEELSKVKAKVESEYRNSIPASSSQQQKLRVCEVCSAYLGVHDNDRRLADHFGGKLHLGFIEIRNKLDELQKYVQAKREERERLRGERRMMSDNTTDYDNYDSRRSSSRHKDRENSSRHRSSRERSRDTKEKDRERKSKKSSRDRSRDRHRDSSRSRKHKHRDRDHRHKKSRSRSRDRRDKEKSDNGSDHKTKRDGSSEAAPSQGSPDESSKNCESTCDDSNLKSESSNCGDKDE